MKIGMIGLGKLGLPVAVAIAERGHEVLGYDLDPARMSCGPMPEREAGPDGTGTYNTNLNAVCADDRLRFGTLKEVVETCDLVFVAVQTPHDPEFEGITRVPDERRDFNYGPLMLAMHDLAHELRAYNRRMRDTERPEKDLVVVVISTVLPGTMRGKILPLCDARMHVAYNPFFIAMGTTMRDFLNPEFVLMGADEFGTRDQRETNHEHPLFRFYSDLFSSHRTRLAGWQWFTTSIEDAELIKVAYNTFIGMKIAFANTLMEVCHKSPGCDVDAVTSALKLGTDRLISPAYLDGGMGDGGGCHPRDNIALSWLARKLDLSYDWFDHVMRQRERSTEWLADLMCEHDLPKAIIGTAFKPGTNLTVGSPALLLKAILEERGHSVRTWDPFVDECGQPPDWFRLPHCFLMGTRHPEFSDLRWPIGGVVIDPWRFLPESDTAEVIPVGRYPLPTPGS